MNIHLRKFSKKNYLLRHLQNQTLTFITFASSEVIEVKEVITPFGRSGS